MADIAYCTADVDGLTVFYREAGKSQARQEAELARGARAGDERASRTEYSEQEQPPGHYLVADIPGTIPVLFDVSLIVRITSGVPSGDHSRHAPMKSFEIGSEGVKITIIVQAPAGASCWRGPPHPQLGGIETNR